MSDISSYLAAFARLSSEERERSACLLKAYNDAVFETHPASVEGRRASSLFSPDEIDSLVKAYQADRLSSSKPAMERYLGLLDRGYRWPSLG